MGLSLNGKIIVITGASAGIGKELAFQVAKQGAIPILLARSAEKLRILAEELEHDAPASSFYPVDVSDEESVKDVFRHILKTYGHIDILVNNAGFGMFENLVDTPFDTVKEMFAVNVFGLIACTKEVIPTMLARNKGHIINIASQAGKLATPKSTIYTATKHAVIGFSNSLRMELAPSNIIVSTVNPGPIRTQFFELADKSGNYVKNVERYMLDVRKVAQRITKLMEHPKRELNLPWWMNVGSMLYSVMPALVEKVGGKAFRMK